ncbi:hypothetical protein POL68_01065 [Stigmatella sp. ncwal1]|uniref:Uncharacterized protein n=1 Tax=Stigmatella ashevillensis TaxID=2995309 RepID=A0ABT5D048_9BACT|nr:hypothetical protein [Stigmatella ashevillena]MDC0707050.1 hypothetical protein [Stigmatella ashevillena]
MSRIGDTTSRPTAPTARPPEQAPAPSPEATARPAAQPTPPATGHSPVSEFIQQQATLGNATNVANASGVPSGISGMFPRTPPNLSLGLNRLNVAGSLAAVPLSAMTARNDIARAQANPSQGTIAQATASTLSVPRNTLAAAGAVFTASNARTYRDAHRAAETAFRTAAPNASEAAVRAASRTAARSSVDALTTGIRSGADAARPVNSAGVRAVESAVTAGVRGSSDDAIRTVMGAGTRAAARAELRTAAAGTARAATSAAVHSGAGAVGRAAARFAPGVNVAVAALDVGVAAATWANPQSSTTARVTSSITALGSVAAATNIPIVSQVGAGVSVVSSFVGGLFGGD